ncbi:hypothetical protein CVT26_007395 [Gymnopilus dilepis]|uniref:Uncharacterized protein n=1 Tax=Gymnopilus dilepis TaxID=231916 RepID=A0A409X116_9AGAR|nr:hypothetical protein CVT26_007395 [Gymnopilus dilepis]
MVNPGAFSGSRKAFLMAQKPTYAEAVVGGYVPDALADIQRRYFKRYPVDFPHDQEPTAEQLAAVDDDGPEPEIKEPDREAMDEQEYQDALDALEKRSEQIRFRKGQIKRWMAYQYMKDQDAGDKADVRSDPCFNNLINQLSGKEAGRPRKKTAVNVWRKTQRENIETKVKNLAESKGISKDRWAALRDKIARELFSQLSKETQDKWKAQAEEETKLAVEEYERSLKADPSTKPEDRQRAIQRIVRTTQPILDTLAKTTGWNFTLLAGGPEPAHGGKLNIISVHTGITTGDVKMNFGRSERADYKKSIVPIFGRFLKKCFSPEECRSRALTADDGLVPLHEEELESSGATFDTLEESEVQHMPYPSNDCTSSLAPSMLTFTSSETSAGGSHEAPSAFPTSPPAPRSEVTQAHSAVASSQSGPTELAAAAPLEGDSSRSMRPEPREADVHDRDPFETPTAGSDSVEAANTHMDDSLPVAQDIPTPAESGLDFAAAAAFTSPVATLTCSLETTAPPDGCRMDISAGSPSLPESLRLSPPLSPRASPPRSMIPDTLDPPSTPSPPAGRLHLSPPPPEASPEASPHTSILTTLSLSSSSAPANYLESSSQLGHCLPTRVVTSPISTTSYTSISTRSSTKRSSSSAASLFETSLPKRPRFVRDTSPSSFSTSSSTTQRAIEIESSSPKWFASALLMLQMVDLGPVWFDLLESWARFEVRGGYKERGKLGAQHRPGCIGDWIQRKRSTTWRPVVDVADVGQSFRRWWVALQPQWRLSGDGEVIPSALQGDWSTLCKPGLNGIHSVVVGLFFWGIAAKKERLEEDQWEQGVGHVNRVLISMLDQEGIFDVQL